MSRSLLRRPATLLAIFTLPLMAGGCTVGGGGWAPVSYGGGAVSERGLPPGGTYTVQRGDTIYGIARQYNFSVRALIDANNLQPPYQLTVGQVLALPMGGDYVVVRGDTLTGVAHKTGVPFSTLVRINNLSAPYVVKVGQRLKLPAGSGDPSLATGPQVIESQRVAETSVPPPVAPVAPPPPKAEGGYTPLAERLPKAPPAPASAVPAAPAPAPQLAPAAEEAAASASGEAAAPAQATAQPAEQHVAALPPPALPEPPARSGRGFIWPVHGDVIAEFGAAGKGQHNDGINIAVPRGTPVVAADDGVVAYAGNELRGFGNLLLIKHADGWMTAYAHNDTLLVKRGQSVKRGQTIAKVGDTGGVGQPQLHFEVRQGTRAVDPMSFLGGKITPASSQGGQPDPG